MKRALAILFLANSLFAAPRTFDVTGQVLGIARGADVKMAMETLLSENPWIVKAGFDPAGFMVKQLMTEERPDTA